MISEPVAHRPVQAQRDALLNVLIALGKEYPNVIVLTPDVAKTVGSIKFRQVYPERFIDTGISEQNTIGLAAGLAAVGWIPLVVGQAMFVAGKAWEQVRNSVAYPATAGINVGQDGVTHQPTEDIALMRSLAHMTVLAPTDANQVDAVMRAALNVRGPVYIRMEREAIPLLTDPSTPFHIGQSTLLCTGRDATVFTLGGMCGYALDAAQMLAAEGISVRVISMVSVKPLDERAVRQAAEETGAIVAAEDHSCYGGLGGAIAECLASTTPAVLEQVALHDTFGESGSSADLYRKYHLTGQDIVAAVRKAIARRGDGRRPR
jgi:transketolase